MIYQFDRLYFLLIIIISLHHKCFVELIFGSQETNHFCKFDSTEIPAHLRVFYIVYGVDQRDFIFIITSFYYIRVLWFVSRVQVLPVSNNFRG